MAIAERFPKRPGDPRPRYSEDQLRAIFDSIEARFDAHPESRYLRHIADRIIAGKRGEPIDFPDPTTYLGYGFEPRSGGRGAAYLDLRFNAEPVFLTGKTFWRSQGVRLVDVEGQPLQTFYAASAPEQLKDVVNRAALQAIAQGAEDEATIMNGAFYALEARVKGGWKPIESEYQGAVAINEALKRTREGVGYFDNRTGISVYTLTGNPESELYMKQLELAKPE